MGANRSTIDTISQLVWLPSIVECCDDAILSANLDRIITSRNSGAERLFGYLAEEAIGRPVAILIPAEPQHEEYASFSRIWGGDRVDHYETFPLVGASLGRSFDTGRLIIARFSFRGSLGADAQATANARELPRQLHPESVNVNQERPRKTDCFSGCCHLLFAATAQTKRSRSVVSQGCRSGCIKLADCLHVTLLIFRRERSRLSATSRLTLLAGNISTLGRAGKLCQRLFAGMRPRGASRPRAHPPPSEAMTFADARTLRLRSRRTSHRPTNTVGLPRTDVYADWSVAAQGARGVKGAMGFQPRSLGSVQAFQVAVGARKGLVAQPRTVTFADTSVGPITPRGVVGALLGPRASTGPRHLNRCICASHLSFAATSLGKGTWPSGLYDVRVEYCRRGCGG
jgi:PAS domain S-box-containing protein